MLKDSNKRRSSKGGLFSGDLIHGTSSCSLPGIKRTNFTLYPISILLERFDIGPLCGEIIKGGYRGSESDGQIAFAPLHSDSNYDFQSILSSYATSRNNSKNTLKTLKHELKFARYSAYSNIQIILIYLSRAKQLGLNTSHLIGLSKLERDIEAHIQLLYLLLLLDEKIFVDKAKRGNLTKETYRTISLAVLEAVDYDALLEKLSHSKLDLEKIFEEPNSTPDDLQPVLELLKTPEPPFESSFSHKLVSSLPDRQFFTSDSKNSFVNGGYNYKKIEHGILSSAELSGFMEAYFNIGRMNKDNADKKYLLEQIKVFKTSLQTLKNIMAVEPKEYAIKKEERQRFVNNPFPLIFVSKYQDITPLFDSTEHSGKTPPWLYEILHPGVQPLQRMGDTSEHRARKPLRLGIGKEIPIVATDTAENQNTLKRFFKENGVDIAVIPFSLLRKEYINAGGHWYEPEPRSLLEILDECSLHPRFDFHDWQLTLKREGRTAIRVASYALLGLLALIAIATSPLLLLIRGIDTIVYKIRMSHYNQLHSKPEPASIRPPSLSEAPLRRTKSTGSLLDTLVAYRQPNKSKPLPDEKTSEGDSCDTVDDCDTTRTPPPTLQRALTV